jgi:hypothetical protein
MIGPRRVVQVDCSFIISFDAAGAWPAERLRDAEPAKSRLPPAGTPPERVHDTRAMHEAALF